MNPVLSLVTGTLNRPESFRRMLDCIEEHTSVPWELVVSDASDESFAYTSGLPEHVVVLRELPRAGCVLGYNRAFRQARGTWVIYLNDDAEVERDYATRAIQFMEQHPEVGLGALAYRDHAITYRVNSAWKMIYANFGILRRELGDRLGWFDEDLTMYGNDNSLTFRVLLAGLGVAAIPDARIFHNVVMDEVKQSNQKYRRTDGHTLTRKYEHLKPQMIRTYMKTAHLSSGATVLR